MMIIDGYVIDCEISGDPTYENEVTQYPVERGSDVNDHVHTKQDTLSVEGIVSDSPIGDVNTTRLYEQIVNGAVAYADAGHQRLLQIHTDKLPVNVTCAMGSFDNMIMLTYTPKRVGDSIQFTATFQAMTFVDNERSTIKVATPRSAKKTMFRNLPTSYTNGFGLSILRSGVTSGPNTGTRSPTRPLTARTAKPMPCASST